VYVYVLFTSLSGLQNYNKSHVNLLWCCIHKLNLFHSSITLVATWSVCSSP